MHGICGIENEADTTIMYRRTCFMCADAKNNPYPGLRVDVRVEDPSLRTNAPGFDAMFGGGSSAHAAAATGTDFSWGDDKTVDLDAVQEQLEDSEDEVELLVDPFAPSAAVAVAVAAVVLPAHPNARKLLLDKQYEPVSQCIYSCVF
jgi:hypothetical protein